MKKLKKIFYFVVIAFFLFTIEVNATSPLWGDLKPGNYAVGYRVMHLFDRSHVFMPERDYEGKVFTGERSRPLQIQIFYPARFSARAAKMSYGDYLNVKANTPVAAKVAENLRQRTRAIHEYFQDLYLKDQKNGLYEKLMKMPTTAIRNAPAATGKFPIVLFAGGASHSTDENVVLWEYLASHGYIVGVIPAQGAFSADFTVDAIGLETKTRDMEFLLEQMRRMPNAEPNRIGVMGFSYGGQAALLLAMRNTDIDAVVGLDPSFISVEYTQPLKNSPFYNVNNVMVPVLELHQNAPTVSYDVTDSLRYAPRYSFDIKGLNHIDFNSYALLYNAVLPEASRRDSPLAEKKAAYETMVRYIRDFFDVYLKGEQTKSSNLTKPAEWKGFPQEAVNFRYSKALPVPPSYAAFLAIIRNQGIDRGERIYRKTQKNDPKAGVVSEESINRLGYDLLNNGMMDEAIRVFLWNIETHPRSAIVYDSLADGYEKKGNLPCAVHYYRKVLEILPLDTTSSESTKTFLQHNATEQLERLKSVSTNAKCRLESGNARLPEIKKELKF